MFDKVWCYYGQAILQQTKKCFLCVCVCGLFWVTMILITSDTNLCSLQWVHEIRHFCPNTPFLLVGLQAEQRYDPEAINLLRKMNQSPVTFEQGQAMAKRIGAACYMECSALTEQGLNEVFERAAATALAPPPRPAGFFGRILAYFTRQKRLSMM